MQSVIPSVMLLVIPGVLTMCCYEVLHQYSVLYCNVFFAITDFHQSCNQSSIMQSVIPPIMFEVIPGVLNITQTKFDGNILKILWPSLTLTIFFHQSISQSINQSNCADSCNIIFLGSKHSAYQI